VGYRGIELDTHVLASVSRSIGIREERRIVGEHRLSEAEARSGVIFADAVAVNTYHIDFHWPDRMERAGTGITDMIDPHHLPLRMMIPRGARNLLVPGRGASGDQTAMSAYRVMAVVAQMGYAAGHAARQCVETGTDLKGIDLPRLQSAIQAGGQSLDLSDYGEYLRNDLFTCEFVRPDPWPGRLRGVVELVQLSNGRLLTVWVVADGVWLAERRERQWQPPRPLVEAPPFLPATIRLRRNGDGGLQLELRNADGARWEAKSIDDGLTWKSVPSDKEETSPGAMSAGGLQVVLTVRENSGGTLEARIRHTLQDGRDRREVIGSPIVLAGGGAAMAVLDDGSIALAFRGPDDHGITALSVAISNDRGETWIGRRAIEAPGGTAREPKVIATRTGLAVLAVEDDRLFFWHGSADRILHGPPPAASHALHA
jgi:hypothetical protein